MSAVHFLSQGVQLVGVAVGVVFVDRLKHDAAFLEDFLGEAEGGFNGRDTNVKGGLDEYFDHLVGGKTDVEGTLNVAAQEVEFPLGHEGGNGGNTTVRELQTGARPDHPEEGFVNNAFEVGCQLVYARQRIVCIVSGRHGTAHILSGQKAVIEGGQGSVPPTRL